MNPYRYWILSATLVLACGRTSSTNPGDGGGSAGQPGIAGGAGIAGNSGVAGNTSVGGNTGGSATCTCGVSVYRVFPTSDECDACTCEQDGGVPIVQEVACPCPVSEWWRDYRFSAQTCGFIDFGCPAPTTHFGNACGCGCEQDLSCPESIDCTTNADAGCDPELIARCPYSQIAQ